jgi:two-component system, sensor histidine kinase and response regulator
MPETSITVATAAIETAWDPAEALERVGGNESLVRQLVQIYAEEAPKQLEKLRTAISADDSETVEMIAHRLRGELSYFGLPNTARKAHDLERLGRNHDLRNALQLFAAFEADLLIGLKAMERMLENDKI